MSERILVTVSDDGTIADVVARLEAAGVTVEKVLEAIGVIVGTVHGNGIRALAEIPGVGAVERDRPIQLPPPDSDVQ